MIQSTAAAAVFSSSSKRQTTRTLGQLLTSCHQVANTLNWNCSKQSSISARLLAVRLNGPQMDLAWLAHPSSRSCPYGWDDAAAAGTTAVNVSIPLAQSKKYLQDLLNNHGNLGNRDKCAKRSSSVLDGAVSTTTTIQGLIIGWPRQPDGWLGYQCGKVFYHLLDAIETSARPAVCLFDVYNKNDNDNPSIGSSSSSGHRLSHQQHRHGGGGGATTGGDDRWGRNPVYGRRTAAAAANRSHLASREQYYYCPTTPMASSMPTTPPGSGAVDLAEQFCKVHWPEYYQQHENNDEAEDDDETMSDEDSSLMVTKNASMWTTAATTTSSFHGSLLPRSAPMMIMPQQQHSWMASGEHHHHHDGTRQRSLASA